MARTRIHWQLQAIHGFLEDGLGWEDIHVKLRISGVEISKRDLREICIPRVAKPRTARKLSEVES